MRAIIIKQFGGLDSLVIENLPDPVPQPGSVLIEVKAFGINHAETHMRKGEWAEAAKVSGIECVGLVKSCPGGEFAEGTKVAALMGGLGRTINGSYAEYTCPPATNVVPVETELSWEDFAVIPESYATAWTCLHRNLEIAKGQTLVIRGATSALGRAAVNIAVDAGAHVIATTRKKQRFEALKELGAHRAEIETPSLSELIPERKQIDAVPILWATAPSWILFACCEGADVCALRDGSAALIRLITLTLCFRCQAEFTSPFLAALCSVLQTFRCRTFLFKPSLIKRRPEFIKRSQLESFDLMIFARRTRRWNRTKPMAKWWFESEGV